MTKNNINNVQQVANKHCIYVYVLTMQLSYTKPAAHKDG